MSHFVKVTLLRSKFPSKAIHSVRDEDMESATLYVNAAHVFAVLPPDERAALPGEGARLLIPTGALPVKESVEDVLRSLAGAEARP